MQGLPTAPAGAIAEPVKVQDPTVVRRTLNGAQVETITVTNDKQSITYNILEDRVTDIQFPSHPSGSLADLLNMLNRLVSEANASSHITAKLAELNM